MSKVFISQEERCQQWLTDTLNFDSSKLNSNSLNFSNELNSINPSIVAMKNLTHLNLTNNKISEIPIELCTMTQLRNLNFYNNIITPEGLPEEIGNLTNLTFLSFSKNKLTSVPESLGNLIELKCLYLYENDFSLEGLPNSLSNLKNLKRFEISHCHLDRFPIEIFPSTLEILKINNNNISELPSDIKKLSPLQKLDLRFNPISDYSPIYQLIVHQLFK
eukprot:TRINITY_DN697_c0_g3_i3.p1 TRINITY_DN697_c0_g3~~TRINITY_DN697_c0_g3_i3.p1  ORF type:complete len:219 (+),score=45.50 TRINITY_DN697_c0_g3_i3:142-798(+)